MKHVQAVFERHEKKYLLTQEQYTAIRKLLDRHMNTDEFGLHTVSSIYLDTETHEIIRTSIQKPPYKEKIRLRSYGTPGPKDTVFLELKKKLDGVVYKRRIALTLQEAERYLRSGIRPAVTGQIFDEIDWVMQRKRPYPAVCISCDRLAMYGVEDPDFRVTFDFRMRWRTKDLSLAQGSGGQPLISPGMVLMEVKTTHALPLWLSRFLSGHEIYPTSFSKYGTCYMNHILGKGELRNVG